MCSRSEIQISGALRGRSKGSPPKVIVFAENAAAVMLLHLDRDLTRAHLLVLCNGLLKRYFTGKPINNHRVVFFSTAALRWLKLILGALQFPIVQQDPMCLAYRLNRAKALLSDGLMTEVLVAMGGIAPKKFFSVAKIERKRFDVVDGVGIVGANWLEFGSMQEASYVRHLRFLSDRYPSAVYYCHPKEASQIPEQVFGAQRVCRPSFPLEVHFEKHGIPRKIVGVLSTSILVVSLAAKDRIDVDLIVLQHRDFDGPKGDVMEPLDARIGPTWDLRVPDTQGFLLSKLQGVAKVRLVSQASS